MKALNEKLLLEETNFEDVAQEEDTQETPENEPETTFEDETEDDTNQEENQVGDEPTNDLAGNSVTYKVSFTLGKHENWSRVDATSEDEASQIVRDYVTKKWPDRDFEVLEVCEFTDEMEAELDEKLNESLDESKENINARTVGVALTNINEALALLSNITLDVKEELYIDEIITRLNNAKSYAKDIIDDNFSEEDKEHLYKEFDLENVRFLTESFITDAEPIETGAAVGMATIISDLIKDEYEAIDGYNSAIATAEAEGFGDMINVLTEIQAEENVHIGQLQTLMNTVDPNAHLVDDGKQEGIEQLSGDLSMDGIEESLKEDLDDMSLEDQRMFIRCVNELWNMSVIEWIQKYNSGQIGVTTVNSYDDIPDTSNLIEIGASDISQGTGNVIVYTYMNAGDGELYSYASY